MTIQSSLPVYNRKDHPDVDVAIPHGTNDLSTYSKFLAIYTRDPESYKLHAIQNKQNANFSTAWNDFVNVLRYRAQIIKKKNDIVEHVIEACDADIFTKLNGIPIKVSEYQRKGETQIRGVITTIENENKFNDWFIGHILDQARLHLNEVPTKVHDRPYDSLFTDYFANYLKNTTAADEWDLGGREHFIERVRYFTDRYLRIECILPAFPCKSSNVQKVHGCTPDKGEELALRRLISVIQEVEKFYSPGMKVWIVSDGHVFSDCIGVDDDVVDSYTVRLHELYQKIAIPGVDAIGFCGLKDLFFDGDTTSSFDKKLVDGVTLEHHTGSKITEDSELSRMILMKGCDTDDGRLRKQILIAGHPRLHLFRGFSRFMMEDLCLLPHFQNMSRKQFKKIVSKVAFEMIKRNDAYSNLVELAFPHHMRLSIHAHTNSGPKFGIKIISHEQCKTVKSLDSNEEPEFEDLLHIPTPWHNCVIKLEESDQYYLVKSKIVADAIKNGLYEGKWRDTSISDGEGGHFIIKKRATTSDWESV